MLKVEHLRKAYGSDVVLNDISFEVSRGEFVSIVGPSGCGKTTLLRCLSGLMSPDRGKVILNDKLVAGPPDGMALVLQEYGRSLYPWMTVEQNVELPIRRKPMQDDQRRSLIDNAIASVSLSDAKSRYPWQLSGGMQQRVAIARALAYQPQILLMDEPFASVDAQTRADLEDLMLSVRKQFGMTVLLVTHDIDEAVYLSDRIVVLSRRPTEVSETLSVNLDSQRDQVTTKEEPEFAHLRAHVWKLIKREPLAA